MKQSPFRSIRHKLFNEGKLVRYLGYAFGEVVLIIVGIMLALQLNNWNEDRKAQVVFDRYVVQLKADVKKAIGNLEDSIESNTNVRKRQEFVLTFLALPEYSPEELTQFERGLTFLGNYSEPQVFVGLLGQLLNGNMDIINRDPNLAQKALEMESGVKSQLGTSAHLYSHLDLATDRLNQFRGKGSNIIDEPSAYDLEFLRSSDEFAYTTQTIKNRLTTLEILALRIKKDLEAFLAVLEEY